MIRIDRMDKIMGEIKQNDFQNTSDDFQARGYKIKDVTITSKMALIKGLIFSSPFVILIGLFYRLFLMKRAILIEIGGISFYLTFILIIVVTVFIHEFLHGFGWVIASKKGWRSIHFNLNAMMPSCSCHSVLSKYQYLFGVLFPFVILGTFSLIYIVFYPGTISILTMIVVFIGTGADLVIAKNLLHEKDDVLISDHPTKAGFITYSKKD